MDNRLDKFRQLMKTQETGLSHSYAKTYAYPGQVKLYALQPLSKEQSLTTGETLFEKEVWRDEHQPFDIQLDIVGRKLTISVRSKTTDYDNSVAQIQLFELNQIAYAVVINVKNGSGACQISLDEIPRARSQPFNLNVQVVKISDLHLS